MRAICTALCFFGMASVAWAGPAPGGDVVVPTAVPCNLAVVTYDWDFTVGDQGFTTTTCDAGGLPAWEYGSTTFVPVTGNCWGTTLQAAYPDDAGHGLVSPFFMVDGCACLLELTHYFDIEPNYDGFNLAVNGTVVAPVGGYTGIINTSTSYYAWCVDMQEGFSGDGGPRVDCFDLTGFMGQEVCVEIDFGSDSHVQYPGVDISKIQIGSMGTSPTESSTWGEIKGLFR